MAYFWARKGRQALQKDHPPFFMAMGLTIYSYFRFGLLPTFIENQAWADWWEESTDFIMIALMMMMLMVFQNQLGLTMPWKLSHHLLPSSNRKLQHQKRENRKG